MESLVGVTTRLVIVGSKDDAERRRRHSHAERGNELRVVMDAGEERAVPFSKFGREAPEITDPWRVRREGSRAF